MSCAQCKDIYAGCMGKEFYEPREIKFCIPQIQWILANVELLKAGLWVTQPSSYQDIAPITRRGKRNAKFTNPIEIVAEVERRLEFCGFDGLLVYLYYGFDFTDQQLAEFYRLDKERVRYRIDAVLWFIAGWNFYPKFYRRWHVERDYEAWKGQYAISRPSPRSTIAQSQYLV